MNCDGIPIEPFTHRLIKIADKSRCRIFKISMNCVEFQDRDHVLRRLRENPLGVCLRANLNEFHLNVEKKTSHGGLIQWGRSNRTRIRLGIVKSLNAPLELS